MKDGHIAGGRNELRDDVVDHLRKEHEERRKVAARATPRFKKYMEDRTTAHEATKRSAGHR